jgi:hypothetical protein
MDAKYHLLLKGMLQRRLKDEGLYKAFKMQNRRVATTVLTQLRGVPTKPDVTREFAKVYGDKIKALESKVAKMVCVARFKRKMGKVFELSNNDDVPRRAESRRQADAAVAL